MLCVSRTAFLLNLFVYVFARFSVALMQKNFVIPVRCYEYFWRVLTKQKRFSSHFTLCWHFLLNIISRHNIKLFRYARMFPLSFRTTNEQTEVKYKMFLHVFYSFDIVLLWGRGKSRQHLFLDENNWIILVELYFRFYSSISSEYFRLEPSKYDCFDVSRIPYAWEIFLVHILTSISMIITVNSTNANAYTRLQPNTICLHFLEPSCFYRISSTRSSIRNQQSLEKIHPWEKNAFHKLKIHFSSLRNAIPHLGVKGHSSFPIWINNKKVFFSI